VIRRIALTLAAAALTLVGAAPAALADTTYSACNGVWVVVDYGSLGGVSTQCATSFSTGTAALRSAGFTPTLTNGFLEQINSKPSSPNRQIAYWSYWHATRNSDGSYGGWSYSNAGANSYHPVKGNAEGWHYVSISGGASAPGATPPKNPVVAAAPAPAKQSTSAAPTKSTKTGTKTTSTQPATSSSSSSAAAPTTSSNTQTSSASPSPSGSVTSPSASPSSPAPTAVPPEGDVPAGSPIAAIATASALAVGTAGAGGWWLWKGRRR
jgi:hypothetical protein